MERTPNQTTQAVEKESNIENLADWRELRDRAPEKARQLIENVSGFETMKPGEQIIALQALKVELADDNTNRFIDRVIAGEIATRMDTMADVTRSEYELPLRTPNERVEVAANSMPEVPEYPLPYTPKAGDGVGVDQVAELAPGVQKYAAR